MTTILTGHTSPDTAYVVEDYPYGFRLRCQIRYWLEANPKRGVRFVSQTSNPKVLGLVWNKPKASTYARFAGCMYLNDEGHCTWTTLDEYSDAIEAQSWRAEFGSGAIEATKGVIDYWIKKKLQYEARKATASTEAPWYYGLRPYELEWRNMVYGSMKMREAV